MQSVKAIDKIKNQQLNNECIVYKGAQV